jgi:2-(1,2-epoxy-1,2-dihydrophenyl)acetyl-CoA isomerase
MTDTHETDTPKADADTEVRCEIDAHAVAWITLHRPEVLNALTVDNRKRLTALFGGFSSNEDVRAIVLTGAGRAFCSGADLRTSRGTNGPPPEPLEAARSMRDGAHDLVLAMLDCNKPIVGAVNGVAAGIGVQMALACDLLVASDNARFVQVFARRGIVPDGGAAFLLPRLVGLNRAKELLFLGDDLAANDAERIGIVNRVVPHDELMAATQTLAHRLASGPTQAIGLTKALIHRSLTVDLATSLELEAFYQAANARTEDAREGLMSFVERRPPSFKGR